jgi:beta-glucosidase
MINRYFEGLNDSITLSCKITNQGIYTGEEIVQLYIRDVVASLVRPVKELKGFQKIYLKPKESKTVTFLLAPKDLGFWNNQQEFLIEPGEFIVYIGPNSQKGLIKSFILKSVNN